MPDHFLTWKAASRSHPGMQNEDNRPANPAPLAAVLFALIVIFHLGNALAGRSLFRAVHLGTALEYAQGPIHLLRPVMWDSMPTTLRRSRNRRSGRRPPGCFSKPPAPRGMAGPTWCRCFASPPAFGRSSNWLGNMSARAPPGGAWPFSWPNRWSSSRPAWLPPMPFVWP